MNTKDPKKQETKRCCSPPAKMELAAAKEAVYQGKTQQFTQRRQSSLHTFTHTIQLTVCRRATNKNSRVPEQVGSLVLLTTGMLA